MAECVRVGSHFFGDRALFLVDAGRPGDIPAQLLLPSRYFACLLAWDATAASDDAVLEMARRLLEAGCAYVCCWGPDCERVHDLIDQVDNERNAGADRVVMTTWHGDEPLAAALWFLLNVAWPDPAFEDECGTAVGVAVGSKQWAAEIRAAFSDPAALSARVSDGQEGSA